MQINVIDDARDGSSQEGTLRAVTGQLASERKSDSNGGSLSLDSKPTQAKKDSLGPRTRKI